MHVGARRIPVTARVATPRERSRLWPRVVALYRGYEQYQRHDTTHGRSLIAQGLDPETVAYNGLFRPRA